MHEPVNAEATYVNHTWYDLSRLVKSPTLEHGRTSRPLSTACASSFDPGLETNSSAPNHEAMRPGLEQILIELLSHLKRNIRRQENIL